MRALYVGLRLCRATELEKDHVRARSADGLNDLVCALAAAGDGAQDVYAALCNVCFRRLVSSMTQRDVSDLMRDDASQLALVFGGSESARVDEDVSAGKRKGVDLFGADDGELVSEGKARSFSREPLAKLLYVAVDSFVAQERHLLRDLLCRAAAKLYVLLRREKIKARLKMRRGSSTRGLAALSAPVAQKRATGGLCQDQQKYEQRGSAFSSQHKLRFFPLHGLSNRVHRIKRQTLRPYIKGGNSGIAWPES